MNSHKVYGLETHTEPVLPTSNGANKHFPVEDKRVSDL